MATGRRDVHSESGTEYDAVLVLYFIQSVVLHCSADDIHRLMLCLDVVVGCRRILYGKSSLH